MVVEIYCNSLENIHGCMVILYGQTLLHRLFHWKSVTVTDQSTKIAKLFHLEQFAIYGSLLSHLFGFHIQILLETYIIKPDTSVCGCISISIESILTVTPCTIDCLFTFCTLLCYKCPPATCGS